MRRRILAVAVTGALLFVAVGSAKGADGIQRLDAVITPTKLDKKKFVPATMVVDNFIATNDESAQSGEQPPSVSRIRLDFPSNVRFRTSAVPRCLVGPGDLENQSATEQQNLCGKNSKVSLDRGSSAQVTYDPTPFGPAGDSSVTSVALQLFNGREAHSIYLATDPEGIGIVTTPTIVGKFGKSDAGDAFGKQLDMTIPSPNLGAFSDLQATVAAGDYLQARCRTRTNNFLARAEYSDHSSTTAADAATCKKKRRKGKK